MAADFSIAQYQLAHRELGNIVIQDKGLFHSDLMLCAFLPFKFCQNFCFRARPVFLMVTFSAATLFKQLISANPDQLYNSLLCRPITGVFCLISVASLGNTVTTLVRCLRMTLNSLCIPITYGRIAPVCSKISLINGGYCRFLLRCLLG